MKLVAQLPMNRHIILLSDADEIRYPNNIVIYVIDTRQHISTVSQNFVLDFFLCLFTLRIPKRQSSAHSLVITRGIYVLKNSVIQYQQKKSVMNLSNNLFCISDDIIISLQLLIHTQTSAKELSPETTSFIH